jgi:hypothetical protein
MFEGQGIMQALAVVAASEADSSMFGGSNRTEGEKAGQRFRKAARDRGFTDQEIIAFSRTLTPGDAVCMAYTSWTVQGNAALMRMHGEFLLGFITNDDVST